MTTIRKCPQRSPEAISEAIKLIITGKLVCELGCAEGDNLHFLSRYASSVCGTDRNPRRYRHAIKRGFKVYDLDYHVDDLPIAEVYYAWPDVVKVDCPVLFEKASKLKYHCTMIVAGDGGNPPEEEVVKNNAAKYNGRVIEVPFNEGSGHRENGIFYLAVVDF